MDTTFGGFEVVYRHRRQKYWRLMYKEQKMEDWKTHERTKRDNTKKV